MQNHDLVQQSIDQDQRKLALAHLHQNIIGLLQRLLRFSPGGQHSGIEQPLVIAQPAACFPFLHPCQEALQQLGIRLTE
ncbi:hypothetical protein [Paenibacillus thiaminolyticus]|nr:hypothetical protein [Paenibacillus thiaminolyticus]